MAAKSFLRLVSGRIREIVATVISAGSANDGDLVALDSTGKLDTSVMPLGIGADTTVLPASEDLSSGSFVNYWNDSGTMKMRKADASTEGKEADGFVKDAYTTGQSALAYNEGTNSSLSGLTLGSRYYLSTTPGGVTTSAPSASGNVVQYLGRAVSATALVFEATDGVVRS